MPPSPGAGRSAVPTLGSRGRPLSAARSWLPTSLEPTRAATFSGWPERPSSSTPGPARPLMSWLVCDLGPRGRRSISGVTGAHRRFPAPPKARVQAPVPGRVQLRVEAQLQARVQQRPASFSPIALQRSPFRRSSNRRPVLAVAPRPRASRWPPGLAEPPEAQVPRVPRRLLPRSVPLWPREPGAWGRPSVPLAPQRLRPRHAWVGGHGIPSNGSQPDPNRPPMRGSRPPPPHQERERPKPRPRSLPARPAAARRRHLGPRRPAWRLERRGWSRRGRCGPLT